MPHVGPFTNNSSSFCVTDKLVASINTRTQNNHLVFQVNLCDLDMNKLKTILLGKCNGNIEIRTDGKDQFFITTGRDKLHIVLPNGKQRTINLKANSDSLAVLNNRTIAVGDSRYDIELVTW